MTFDSSPPAVRHLNILLRRNSLLAGLLFLGSVQVFSQTLPEKHAGSEPAPTTVSPATGSSSKSATKVRDPIGVKQPLALPELERVAVALAQRQSASEISRLVGQVVTIPESRLRAELPPKRLDYVDIAGAAIALLEFGYRDDAVQLLNRLPVFMQVAAPLPPELQSQFEIALARDLSRFGETQLALPHWLAGLEHRVNLAKEAPYSGAHPDARKKHREEQANSLGKIGRSAVEVYASQGRSGDAQMLARRVQEFQREVFGQTPTSYLLGESVRLSRAAVRAGNTRLLERAITLAEAQLRTATFDGRLLALKRPLGPLPDGLYLVRDIAIMASVIQRFMGGDAALQFTSRMQKALAANQSVPNLYRDWIRFIAHRNRTCGNAKEGAAGLEEIWPRLRPALSKIEEFDGYGLTVAWAAIAAGHNDAARRHMKNYDALRARATGIYSLDIPAGFGGQSSQFQAGWLELALGERAHALHSFNASLPRQEDLIQDALVPFIQGGELNIAAHLLKEHIDAPSGQVRWVSNAQRSLKTAGIAALLAQSAGQDSAGRQLLLDTLTDPAVRTEYDGGSGTSRFRLFQDREKAITHPNAFTVPPLITINGFTREQWIGPWQVYSYSDLAEAFLLLSSEKIGIAAEDQATWQLSQWAAYDVAARDAERSIALLSQRDIISEAATAVMSREIDSGAMVRSGFGLGASVDWVDVFVSPCHYFSQNRADESNWYAMGAESNYPWFERVRFRVQQLAQANSSTESTEIESLSAVRKTLSDAPEMKALQDQMADDELVVHTSTHRQFVRVHLVSKRDFWTWNWLIEQSELQEKIQDLRALAAPLPGGTLSNWNAASFALSHMFFSGLLGQVVPEVLSRARSISFILDPHLSRLPTSLLTVKPYEPPTSVDQAAAIRAAPWLDTQFESRYFPSVVDRIQAALSDKPSLPSKGEIIIVADPLFTDPSRCVAKPARVSDLCRLEHTLNVASGVARNRPGEKTSQFLAAKANKIELQEYIASAPGPIDVLAVLTHGLTPGESSSLSGVFDAALALSPANSGSGEDRSRLWSALEIRSQPMNVNWVLLLACNSAGEDAESNGGYTGVARAFLRSGAQSVLVAHWPLFEDSAEAFVPRIVALAQNQTKVAAMRAATQEVRNSNTFDNFYHPAYWAAFVLIE